MDISLASVLSFLKWIGSSAWSRWRSGAGINRDHDVAVFRKLDAIVDEAKMDDLINDRIYTSNITLQDTHSMADFLTALRRIENRYLNKTIQERVNELDREMDGLLGLVLATFWMVRGDRLKFRPDPIDEKIYQAEWKELCHRIDSTWKAYRAYRTAVKDLLKV
jgi:hypothetical protein